MRKIDGNYLEFKGECKLCFIGSDHKKIRGCFGETPLYEIVNFQKRGA